MKVQHRRVRLGVLLVDPAARIQWCYAVLRVLLVGRCCQEEEAIARFLLLCLAALAWSTCVVAAYAEARPGVGLHQIWGCPTPNELQQRAGVAPMFEAAAFTLCSSAAAPPNLQCGPPLFFAGTRMAVVEAASTVVRQTVTCRRRIYCSFRCTRPTAPSVL